MDIRRSASNIYTFRRLRALAISRMVLEIAIRDTEGLVPGTTRFVEYYEPSKAKSINFFY